MREHDHFPLETEHLEATVRIYVPWLKKEFVFEHVFDAHGVREEFRPFGEIFDWTDFTRRRELLEKRERTVEAVAKTIARSMLVAMAKEKL